MKSLNYMNRKTVFALIAGAALLSFSNFSANAISVSLGASKESGVSASVGLGGGNNGSGASVSTGGSNSGAGVSASVGSQTSGTGASASVGSQKSGTGVSVSVGSQNAGADVKARIGSRGAKVKAKIGLGGSSGNVSVSTAQANKIGSLSNMNRLQVSSTLRGLGNTETVKLRMSCKTILASPARYAPEAVQVCRVIVEL